jgi:RimJ/RimL family protein N-acetyltransferase
VSARLVLPAEPLTDGVVALRAWRSADLPALVAICQDPEIPRWTPIPSPYGATDARLWFSRLYDELHDGIAASLAIVGAQGRDTEDELLGSISLLRLSWEHARAEVGYLVAAPARGRGVATRAVRVICRWGFNTLGLERIELLAAAGNLASQRVAEHSGFTREAVLRSYQLLGGERHDMVAFGLLEGKARG